MGQLPKIRYKQYIKRLQQKNRAIQKDDQSVIKFWISLQYFGKNGKNFVKTCIRQLERCFKTNLKFVIVYETKKWAMFCSAKDKNPTHQKSNVVYKLKCPGCGEDYIRKSDRCVITRLIKHSNHSHQLIF